MEKIALGIPTTIQVVLASGISMSRSFFFKPCVVEAWLPEDINYEAFLEYAKEEPIQTGHVIAPRVRGRVARIHAWTEFVFICAFIFLPASNAWQESVPNDRYRLKIHNKTNDDLHAPP